MGNIGIAIGGGRAFSVPIVLVLALILLGVSLSRNHISLA